MVRTDNFIYSLILYINKVSARHCQDIRTWSSPMAEIVETSGEEPCLLLLTSDNDVSSTYRQSVLGVDISEPLDVVEDQPREWYYHEHYERNAHK